MVKVLEVVPNVSEGRDLAKLGALVEEISGVGVEVLDWSADPDHNRAVITFIGDPASVEEASVVVARFAIEHIDLRSHRGVHPRVGALDVLPFVPIHGVGMADAVDSAHRVGQRIADLGVPVFFYGEASNPPGRGLAGLRKGGFERLVDGFPDQLPADLPTGAATAHPTAGVTCVGARPVLLAWNVFVTDLELDDARDVAASIRERDGGFVGLRALGLYLPKQKRVQISMNLEDPARTPPMSVFDEIERMVVQKGGRIAETQVIGMIPDTLVLPPTVGRLHLSDSGSARVLSSRVAEHVSRHARDHEEISDTTE